MFKHVLILTFGAGLVVGCGDDETPSDTGGSAGTTTNATDDSTTAPSGTSAATDSGTTAPSTTDATQSTTNGTTEPTAGTGMTESGTVGPTGGETESATDSGTTTTNGTTAAGTTAAGTTGSTGSTGPGTTTGGEAMLEAQMTGLSLTQDCMPFVDPDPLAATASLTLENTGDVIATATVVSATFYDQLDNAVATIEISPSTFGPYDPGEIANEVITKDANSLDPAMGCNTLLCNQTYTLVVVLDVDGTEITGEATTQVACVF